MRHYNSAHDDPRLLARGRRSTLTLTTLQPKPPCRAHGAGRGDGAPLPHTNNSNKNRRRRGAPGRIYSSSLDALWPADHGHQIEGAAEAAAADIWDAFSHEKARPTMAIGMSPATTTIATQKI